MTLHFHVWPMTNSSRFSQWTLLKLEILYILSVYGSFCIKLSVYGSVCIKLSVYDFSVLSYNDSWYLSLYVCKFLQKERRKMLLVSYMFFFFFYVKPVLWMCNKTICAKILNVSWKLFKRRNEIFLVKEVSMILQIRLGLSLISTKLKTSIKQFK